eukprot:3343335-Ditylum_brightwellii.AAC.2
MMMSIIFSVTNMVLHSLVSRLEGMRVAEYMKEDISWIMGFICGLYTILNNCKFLPPDFMEIIYEVSFTASDEVFIQCVNTIHTNMGLDLLPTMDVRQFLDNIELLYNSKVKAT